MFFWQRRTLIRSIDIDNAGSTVEDMIIQQITKQNIYYADNNKWSEQELIHWISFNKFQKSKSQNLKDTWQLNKQINLNLSKFLKLLKWKLYFDVKLNNKWSYVATSSERHYVFNVNKFLSLVVSHMTK